MINWKSILIPLIATFFMGCVAKVDCLSAFRVSGSMFNQESSTPLEDVKVYFIDKGLDTYRSKVENSIEIGKSDSHGAINTEFEYFWGYDKSWFHKEPPLSFEILVTKQGFKEKRLFFKAFELERSGDYFQVPLGVLQLDKD
jgi:hypothetical protein